MSTVKHSDELEEAMQAALKSVEKHDASDASEPQTQAEDDAAVMAQGEAEMSPEARIAELEEKVGQAKDQLLRMAADFENFRKRARREQEDVRLFGAERLLRDMLPVVDNLDRALAHATAADSSNPLVQGIQMVAKQFVDVLAAHGVAVVSSKGEVFDPQKHEAMGQVPSSDVQPGHVIEEIDKGYVLRGRLLRPAKVIVAMAMPAVDGGAAAQDEAAAPASANEQSAGDATQADPAGEDV